MSDLKQARVLLEAAEYDVSALRGMGDSVRARPFDTPPPGATQGEDFYSVASSRGSLKGRIEGLRPPHHPRPPANP